jgi:AmmeMemoRadiSam system protein B/AmmeMemoRadiSam system protein A
MLDRQDARGGRCNVTIGWASSEGEVIMRWDRGPALLRAGLTLLICLSLALSAGAEERIRPSAVAGTWYPADPQQLADYVDALLDAVEPVAHQIPIRALIVPHAGYRFSGATAAEAFAQVRGREYKRVIVLAPSHRSGFRGLSIAEVDAYQTPLGTVPLDAPAVAELRKSDLVGADQTAHLREHAIEIELPMLQRTLKPGWRLVPLLVGEMQSEDYEAAADLLRPLADEATLVVVSSDFTHFGPRFGYLPFPLDEKTPSMIRELDEGAIERIVNADAAGFLDYQASTGITICGYRALAVLLDLLPPGARVQRIAYTSSGALSGDWGNSVSYVGMLVASPDPFSGSAREHGNAAPRIGTADLVFLHRLAALGVEQAVLGRSDARSRRVRELLEGLPGHLKEKAGAFVTLKRRGHLRGCIGYIFPRKPLFQAVLENGYNAARTDPRFLPVAPEELHDLSLEISVLSRPRPIDSYEDFLVGEQGVILRKEGHQAVYLPQVALEQGWSREDTLAHLARKAGLPMDGWREGAEFAVFTATEYIAPYAGPDRGSGPLAKTGSGGSAQE